MIIASSRDPDLPKFALYCTILKKTEKLLNMYEIMTKYVKKETSDWIRKATALTNCATLSIPNKLQCLHFLRAFLHNVVSLSYIIVWSRNRPKSPVFGHFGAPKCNSKSLILKCFKNIFGFR